MTFPRWHGFSKDTFRRGGDLVDVGHWYAMPDKTQHLLAFGCLWLLLALLPLPFTTRLLVWQGFSLGTELVEWVRYDAYVRSGFAGAWPALADKPSWRDLIANHIGLLVAQGYLALL